MLTALVWLQCKGSLQSCFLSTSGTRRLYSVCCSTPRHASCAILQLHHMACQGKLQLCRCTCQNLIVAVLQAFIEQLVLQKAEATSKAAPT